VPEAKETFELPIALAPEERRDFARRLAERLGTKTAGGLSVLCEPAEPPTAATARYRLDGNAGEVKVRGLQQLSAAAKDGRWRFEQRDAIGVGGLDGGLAILLAVEEAWDLPGDPGPVLDHAAARLPATVRVEVREGGEEALARARDEAYRTIGERFFPLLTRKDAGIAELPVATLAPQFPPAAEARPWLRGRWCPPPPRAGAGWGRLALVLDPHRSGKTLLVREALVAAEEGGPALERAFRADDRLGIRLAARRAIAPLFVVEAGAVLSLRTIDRKIEKRVLEKAISALAWDAAGTAPADPRPMPRKLSALAADAQTIGARLGGARTLEAEIRDFPSGAGARMAAIDVAALDGRGTRVETVHERLLAGLPDGGLAVLTSVHAAERGRGDLTSIAIAGPKKTAERWLDKLMRNL
jgi:hypothetical protein